MSLHLQPVQVTTGSYDIDGQLVFVDGFLAAVLVRLSDFHEGMAGMWFLEAGFGRLDNPTRPTFSDLDEAQDWTEQQFKHAA
ncbi:hypothetical protein [Methylobacterium sp. CM6246]